MIIRYLHVVIFSLSMTIAACTSEINGQDLKKVSHMHCDQITKEELKYILNEFSDKYQYKTDKDSQTTVQFQFNLDPADTDEYLFAIASRRAGKLGKSKRNMLYVGPYKTRLIIPVDARLAAGKYYDNIDFRLLHINKSRYCSWANSLEYPYWKPNADIEIDFLAERRIDEDELVYMFDVKIR